MANNSSFPHSEVPLKFTQLYNHSSWEIHIWVLNRMCLKPIFLCTWRLERDPFLTVKSMKYVTFLLNAPIDNIQQIADTVQKRSITNCAGHCSVQQAKTRQTRMRTELYSSDSFHAVLLPWVAGRPMSTLYNNGDGCCL